MVGASERASEPRERSAAPRPRESACWGVRGAKPLGSKKPGRCSIQLSCVLSRKTKDGRRKTEDGRRKTERAVLSIPAMSSRIGRANERCE